MPAKRLPWFKLWPEAIEHEKVAQLSDGVFRTWVTALAKAADQPTRWRFASRRHAAAVTGRPTSHIQALVNFRLLDDQGAEGLWIHDWQQWQERYPSDFESPPPSPGDHPPEHSANGAAKPPPTLHDRSDKKREGRRENVELERDEEPLAPSGHPPSLAVLSNRSARVIDALRATGPDVSLSKRDHAAIKGSTAAPGQIAAAYRAVESGEYGDDFMRKRLSVHEAIEWVNGYQAWLAKQQPLQLHQQPELEPGPMCRRCGQHEQYEYSDNPDGLCGMCIIAERQVAKATKPA